MSENVVLAVASVAGEPSPMRRQLMSVERDSRNSASVVALLGAIVARVEAPAFLVSDADVRMCATEVVERKREAERQNAEAKTAGDTELPAFERRVPRWTAEAIEKARTNPEATAPRFAEVETVERPISELPPLPAEAPTTPEGVADLVSQLAYARADRDRFERHLRDTEAQLKATAAERDIAKAESELRRQRIAKTPSIADMARANQEGHERDQRTIDELRRQRDEARRNSAGFARRNLHLAAVLDDVRAAHRALVERLHATQRDRDGWFRSATKQRREKERLLRQRDRSRELAAFRPDVLGELRAMVQRYTNGGL